jgi:hypothetical protein
MHFQPTLFSSMVSYQDINCLLLHLGTLVKEKTKQALRDKIWVTHAEITLKLKSYFLIATLNQ